VSLWNVHYLTFTKYEPLVCPTENQTASENVVEATFGVVYTLGSTEVPDLAQFQEAGGITQAYLQQALEAVLIAPEGAESVTVVPRGLWNDPATIGYTVQVEVLPDSPAAQIVTPEFIAQTVQGFLNPPLSDSLVTALTGLDATNPFSTTTGIAYTEVLPDDSTSLETVQVSSANSLIPYVASFAALLASITGVYCLVSTGRRRRALDLERMQAEDDLALRYNKPHGSDSLLGDNTTSICTETHITGFGSSLQDSSLNSRGEDMSSSSSRGASSSSSRVCGVEEGMHHHDDHTTYSNDDGWSSVYTSTSASECDPQVPEQQQVQETERR